jgi:hypothetical protein
VEKKNKLDSGNNVISRISLILKKSANCRAISSKMAGGKYLKAEIVRKKGKNMLNDPIFNKGLAFPRSERDRLDIRGKVILRYQCRDLGRFSYCKPPRKIKQ